MYVDTSWISCIDVFTHTTSSTDVTGPSDATEALLLIYDIFGFQDQILQGADILAHSDKEHRYQVYMPDFFDGDYINRSDYPPQTQEQKSKVGAWFGDKANPEKAQKRIPQCLKAAEESNSSIKTWGALGFCWGGKMVSLASGPGSPFKAAAQSSPAMVDAKDAEKVSIPMCMLASKDEPAEEVKKYEQSLKGVKHVEIYDTQLHGFMSARGDLKDKDVVKEYERGYKTILTFFHDNL
jgi:dienelactone hydrolase